MEIAEKFSELRRRGERALVLFVTAGDPSLEDLPEILSALEEGDADLIEVGIPFSDPIADGPIIQASSQRALDRGVSPSKIFDVMAKQPMIERQSHRPEGDATRVPLIAMGYYNTVLRSGVDTFAQQLSSAGFSGSILSDLTPDEASVWRNVSSTAGIDTIFLAAPTSSDERLELVCEASSGFVYAVSRTGVTGSKQSVPTDVAGLVERIKQRTGLPVCVGFGFSTPEHVRMVCEVADGAVVGSWLVDWLAKNWKGGKGRAELVEKVRALKDATR